MTYYSVNLFIIVSVLIASFALLVSYWAWKTDAMGRWLGRTGVLAAVSLSFYLVRILTDDVDVFSIATSGYLFTLAAALFCGYVFCAYYVQFRNTPMGRISVVFFSICLGVDFILQVLNPHTSICLEFLSRDTLVARFFYGTIHPLYWFHLGLAYALIFAVVFVLIRRAVMVPREFRRQYLVAIGGLLVIFGGNFLNIFIASKMEGGDLDYSVGMYCLIPIFFYWLAYWFSGHDMLNYFKGSIFENVEQGLVLFDYTGRMILYNQRARQMLASIPLGKREAIGDFLERIGVQLDYQDPNLEHLTMQCRVANSGQIIHLRCNYRRIKNHQGVVLGNLFVFSDVGLETDVRTGFLNWMSFRSIVSRGVSAAPLPMLVVAADINNLSFVNSVHGLEKGDSLLMQMASLMRKEFPGGTYFVRGEEALLIALCYNMPRETGIHLMENVRRHFEAQFLYAMGEANQDEPDVLHVIEVTSKALRQKKMLDWGARHSEILTSLMQSQQEYDVESDVRTKRIQAMSARLGIRLRLSDREMDDLSLLSLLYDIGKISVPHEILYKPDKLTSDEWKIVQSHVERGCQIAKSSKDLVGVAEYIRSHHERWDGKGYPDGLSRESIPLLSRIISVVVAYDAMTSDRPYRKALSRETAVTELKACSGTQFDPFIVSEFLHTFDDVPLPVEVPSSPLLAETVQRINSLKHPEPESLPHMDNIHGLKYSRYVVNSQMKIVAVDDMFVTMTGYTRQDITEKNLTQPDLIPPEDQTQYLCLLSESLAKTKMAYFEHRILRKDGSCVYVFCLGKLFYDSSSREMLSEVIITDCSDSYAMRVFALESNARAAAQLTHWEDTYRKDSLTGLMTRTAFRSEVEGRLLTDKFKVMLLMIDVDNFKEFNDKNGHRIGDEFLELVAHSITASLRHNDMACRLGGDEFAAALFFDKNQEADFMYSRAQQIFDKIGMLLSSGSCWTTISMGAAVSENPEVDFKDLYEQSDRALVMSKREGRNRMSRV